MKLSAAKNKGMIKGLTVLSLLVAILFAAVAVSTYVIPAFAQAQPVLHNATLTLSPSVTTCDGSYTFAVDVEHTGGDPIEEVRLYNGEYLGRHTEIPPHTDYACGAAPNSSWVLFDLHPSIPACQYNVIQGEDPLTAGSSLTFTFDATVTSESNYKWSVETRDSNFQWRQWNLSITVDCTSPNTTKTFIGPQKIEVIDHEVVEWIDGVTLVNLTATDDVEHNSGVDKTWYRNDLVTEELVTEEVDPDGVCFNPSELCNDQVLYLEEPPDTQCVEEAQESCSEDFDRETEFNDWADCVEEFVDGSCVNEPGWKLYRGPFAKEEESCHVLQFFSVDNVGNTEDVNLNCFFVDKTPPVVIKDHGQLISGEEDLDGDGQNDTFHLISPLHNITFTCEDQEPHPSEGEEVCFRVSFDQPQYPTYLTDLYAAKYQTVVGLDGFACVPVDENNQFVFNFNDNEDSVHDLEYYCKDAVEKNTSTQLQWYKVDTKEPVITKEMFGSWLGDCPPGPEPSDDECFVADNGQSGVTVWAEDEGHAEDFGLFCGFLLWWKTDAENCEGSYDEENGLCLVGSGEFSDDDSVHFNITFNEDSTHLLNVTCVDFLGNVVSEEEEYLVDSTPPETEKEYGDPVHGPELFPLTNALEPPVFVSAHYISVETPITLTPSDEKVGVEDTFFIVKEPCVWENSTGECNQTEWVGQSDYQIYHDLSECLTANQGQCVSTFWNVKTELTPDWTVYEGPFVIPQESVHKICFYSVDKLGNTEQIECQVAVVDDTPPVMNKTIGQPQKVVEVCEEVQDGGIGPESLSLRSGDTYVGNSGFGIQSHGVCASATEPEQCEVFAPSALPPFVNDALETLGADLENCNGEIVVLSSGDPADNDTDLSTNMENPGCGDNPDGFSTNDCVVLDYTLNVSSKIVALSSEWQEFQFSSFTDWMEIAAGNVSVNISINDWPNDTALISPPYGPSDTGITVLALLDSGQQVLLRVADSSDSILDTALVVVPHSCILNETKTPLFCGDNITQPGLGEECDDGNLDNDDLCNDDCKLTECGDGVQQTPNGEGTGGPLNDGNEACDDGNQNNDDACNNNCELNQPTFCGDGNLDPGEQCDDGNTVSGDGCSSTCEDEFCGDGIVQAGLGEECDPPDGVTCDGLCQSIPPIICINQTFIGPQTPINFECTDPEPHPVDHATIHWRVKVSEGSCDNLDQVPWGNWSWSEGDEQTIYLPEDSCHQIEFFCKDALNNTGEHQFETDIVDAKPPETNKTILGPLHVKEVCEEPNDGLGPEAVGDLLTDITMPTVDAFTDVGVAFDGTVLYVPDGTTVIQLIDPADGSQAGTLATDPAVDLDAMAFDTKRGVLWACSHGSPHKLYKVDVTDGTATLITDTLPGAQFSFCDGLAYDENDPSIDADDRLWYSPDVSSTVYLLDLIGTELDSFSPDLGACGSSGIAVGGDDLYLANNGCDEIYRFDKGSLISLGLFSAPGDRPEDLECDPVTFPGKDAIWVRMFENNHLKAYEIADGTCGLGGQPPSECHLQEYIDTTSSIVLNATDPEPHPSGVNATYWRNTLLEGEAELACQFPEIFCNTEFVSGDGDWQLWNGTPIHKNEESCHLLEFFSDDMVSNVEDTNFNCFFVDKTPPVTSKEYGEPFFSNDTGEWISTETNVTLSAHDPEPHPSGVNATYWRNTLVDDTFCNGINIIDDDNDTNDDLLNCNNATGSGSWNLYTGPFQKEEESCHLIEFFSVDNVNKTEQVNKQCVFVDDTPPTPNKTVGEVKSIINHTLNWNDYEFEFYPQVNGLCFNGTNENAIDCWKVTTMTPITLDCNDLEPHPVDHENVCFKVDLDGEDVTEDYCDEVSGGNFNETGDGFCCTLEEAPTEFFFAEESEHNLKFYCQDALGNKGPTDEEKFKVEGINFNITINKKWNLISVPFVLLNDSMHAVFNANPKIKSVWTYDPLNTVCGSDWCVFTPDGVDNDNLPNMVPGMGYWVLANQSTSLLIGGSLFSPMITPPSKEMVNGWNLIGYYGNEDEFGDPVFIYDGPDGDGAPAACALGTLVNTVFSVPKWSSLWTYWEPFNPDQWIPLDFFDSLDPGAGYWLEIDLDPGEEEFYSPSTTCPFLFP